MPAKETGTQTKTTTTIGMTNMTVTSYNSQEMKKSGASLDFSYNLKPDQLKFVVSASHSKNAFSLEQVLVLDVLIDQNKGKLTKGILNKVGIPYTQAGSIWPLSSDNTIGNVQMAYDSSKKGMTVDEANDAYQAEKARERSNIATLAVLQVSGGFRVGNQKTAFSTSLTQTERTAVQRSSGAKAAGSTSGKGAGSVRTFTSTDKYVGETANAIEAKYPGKG